MAVVALIVARYVSWSFPRSLCAVVTANAVSAYGGVINKTDDAPVRCNVTVGAFTIRRNVIGRL